MGRSRCCNEGAAYVSWLWAVSQTVLDFNGNESCLLCSAIQE